LKLCPKTNTYLSDLGISVEEDITEGMEEKFNEVLSSQEMPIEIVFNKNEEAAGPPQPNCLLCEEVVKIAEKKINKNTSKEDIVKALNRSCDRLRKNLQSKCHTYIDKYGDKIASLLIKEMEPKTICREIGLCLWSEQDDLEIDEALKYDVIALPNDKAFSRKSERLVGLDDVNVNEIPSCVICEFVMTKLEIELKDKTEQEQIKRSIEKICRTMPRTVSQKCDKFIEEYGTAIFAMIGSVPPKEMCTKMMLCIEPLKSNVADDVIECGVCHGATKSLLPFYAQHLDTSAIGVQDMINAGCQDLPAKYYEICSEMVRVYGLSILHLYEKKQNNESHICSEIGKCFDHENSNLAFLKISA